MIQKLIQTFSYLLWPYIDEGISAEGIGSKMRLWLICQLRLLSFLSTVNHVRNILSRGILITVGGLKYRVRDLESLFIIFPRFEKWMKPYLRIREGDVFIDVGAHIGKYTLYAAKKVGRKGLVVALEPHPENYKLLKENIQLNSLENNVIALNIAAWNKTRELKLFLHESSGGSSLKKDMGLGFIRVKAKALDEVFKELGLRRVDWIKIDVEGSEFEVLKGLRRTLQSNSPNVIAEVTVSQKEKVVSFMNALGYNHTIIYEDSQAAYMLFTCHRTTRTIGI